MKKEIKIILAMIFCLAIVSCAELKPAENSDAKVKKANVLITDLSRPESQRTYIPAGDL